MSSSVRTILASAAIGTLCALTATFAVLAVSRPAILVTSPSASSTTPSIEAGVLTSGNATVSVKPDLALVNVGVDAKANTATAAQADLASKAAKLIARIKSLGVADKDLSTSNYNIGPYYLPSSGTVDGYEATETLLIKWHNVDTTGKVFDAVVQEGGATQVSVSFGLADPKAAQAEARSLAIADARSRAAAMAAAAGVTLGKVVRVTDLGFSGYTSPAFAAPAALTTQVPVGQLDIQVTVEVDFAIAG